MAQEIVNRIYIVMGLTILSGLGVFLVIPFSDTSKPEFDLDGLGEEMIQSPSLMASYLYILTSIGPFFAEIIPGRVLRNNSNNEEFRMCQTDIYLMWVISFAITPLLSIGSIFYGCSPRTVGIINQCSVQMTCILFTGIHICNFWVLKVRWRGTYPTVAVTCLNLLFIVAVYCDTIIRICDLSEYTYTVLALLASCTISIYTIVFIIASGYEYMESRSKEKDLSEMEKETDFFRLQIGYFLGGLSYTLRLFTSEYNFLLVDNFIKFLLFNVVSSAIVRRNRERSAFLGNSLANHQSFICYISHQLRSPLNVIELGLAMITIRREELAESDTELSDCICDVEKASKDMVDLLDQVLKYQLLSTFLLRLEKTWVPVGPFIKEYVERLKLVSTEKHVSLNLHLHPNDDPSAPSFDTEKVLLDRTKFGIIIINIVSNAVKFSPAHKSIDINAYFIKTDIKHEKKRSLLRCCKRKVRPSSARVREWTLVIEFIDQGVGLKAESLKKLFVEVIQFDANLNQGGGGSGMGMFIAKGIADLHGGTLTAHSDGLDMGSTFTVTLPLDQYEEEDDDDFTVSQLESSSSVEKESGSNYDRDTGRDIGMQVEVDIESRPSSVPIPSLGGPAPSFPFHKVRKEAQVAANADQEKSHWDDDISEDKVFGGKRILLVDDVPSCNKMVSKLLEGYGCKCDLASSGVEALDMVASRERIQQGLDAGKYLAGDSTPYDLILMDNFMPEMSGMECTKRLRSELHFTNPIVGLTGHTMTADVAKFIQSGADFVLPKPLELTALVQCLLDVSTSTFVISTSTR